MSNLPVTLLALGGGGLLVWAGITKPDGGVWGELRRVLEGTPSQLHGAPDALEALTYSSAFAAGQAAGVSASPTSLDHATAATGKAAAAISFAGAQLGKPYLWGGTGPDRWDCSGLTQAAYRKAGVTLPRVAAAQQLAGAKVAGLGSAVPGDLIFYGYPAHHVAIYLGANRIRHAPYTGTVVRDENVSGPGTVSTVRRVA